MRVGLCLALTVVLWGGALCCARADMAVYVRNVRVPPPAVWVGSEVYAPRGTVLKLFNGAMKDVSIDGRGHVVVDGASTPLTSVKAEGQDMIPIFGLARKLGWEIRPNPSVGIVDVSSPRNVRMANLQAQERVTLPIDGAEEAASKHAARKLMERFGVCDDALMQARVNRIGMRLAAVVPRAHARWEFIVLNTQKLNAFSVGGGRIFVTRGMLTNVDDEELAGAMAHEMGHDQLRHTQRGRDVADEANVYIARAQEARQRQRDILEHGGSTSDISYQGAVDDERENTEKAQRIVGRLAKWTTNDQWDIEKEADRMGMFYARDAGFDPLAVMRCLEKLAEDSPQPVKIEGVSDHPPIKERIEICRQIYSTYFAGHR